jgi:hypothetical protein
VIDARTFASMVRAERYSKGETAKSFLSADASLKKSFRPKRGGRFGRAKAFYIE